MDADSTTKKANYSLPINLALVDRNEKRLATSVANDLSSKAILIEPPNTPRNTILVNIGPKYSTASSLRLSRNSPAISIKTCGPRNSGLGKIDSPAAISMMTKSVNSIGPIVSAKNKTLDFRSTVANSQTSLFSTGVTTLTPLSPSPSKQQAHLIPTGSSIENGSLRHSPGTSVTNFNMTQSSKAINLVSPSSTSHLSNCTPINMTPHLNSSSAGTNSCMQTENISPTVTFKPINLHQSSHAISDQFGGSGQVVTPSRFNSQQITMTPILNRSSSSHHTSGTSSGIVYPSSVGSGGGLCISPSPHHNSSATLRRLSPPTNNGSMFGGTDSSLVVGSHVNYNQPSLPTNRISHHTSSSSTFHHLSDIPGGGLASTGVVGISHTPSQHLINRTNMSFDHHKNPLPRALPMVSDFMYSSSNTTAVGIGLPPKCLTTTTSVSSLTTSFTPTTPHLTKTTHLINSSHHNAMNHILPSPLAVSSVNHSSSIRNPISTSTPSAATTAPNLSVIIEQQLGSNSGTIQGVGPVFAAAVKNANRDESELSGFSGGLTSTLQGISGMPPSPRKRQRKQFLETREELVDESHRGLLLRSSGIGSSGESRDLRTISAVDETDSKMESNPRLIGGGSSSSCENNDELSTRAFSTSSLGGNSNPDSKQHSVVVTTSQHYNQQNNQNQQNYLKSSSCSSISLSSCKRICYSPSPLSSTTNSVTSSSSSSMMDLPPPQHGKTNTSASSSANTSSPSTSSPVDFLVKPKLSLVEIQHSYPGDGRKSSSTQSSQSFNPTFAMDGPLIFGNSKHNHFLKSSNVKVASNSKMLKRPTIYELVSQKHALHKVRGWKLHRVTSQMSDLRSVEHDLSEKLNELHKRLEDKSLRDARAISDMSRVQESVKANIQRTKLIQSELKESTNNCLTLLSSHKEQVSQIMRRYLSKRQARSSSTKKKS